MRNYQLLPRTGEESIAVIPLLERLINEEFEDLTVVREASGERLKIKKPIRIVARACPKSNIVYYTRKADKDRRDLDVAIDLKNMFQIKYPESGEWIVRYFQDGN